MRSLGWVEISEEDLTPERSSKAVNKCIVDLSLGLNSIMDAVGRWGDVRSYLIAYTFLRNDLLIGTFIDRVKICLWIWMKDR